MAGPVVGREGLEEPPSRGPNAASEFGGHLGVGWKDWVPFGHVKDSWKAWEKLHEQRSEPSDGG